MDIWKYPLLVLISFGGSFLQRVTGFGYGIFMMMFLPGLVGSSVESAALAGLISCCTCSYNAIRMRGSVQWKLAVPTVAASLITVPIAVRWVTVVPETLVRTLLGVVLILLSIYFLFFAGKIKLRPSVPGGLAAGAVSGILGGMFSMGGPPIVLYLVQAINVRDYPCVRGAIIYIAVTFSLIMLVVDVLYAFIDPRIRAQYIRRKKKEPVEQAAEQKE